MKKKITITRDIYIGIAVFIVACIACCFIIKLVHHSSYVRRYKEILDIAKRYEDLEIENISDNGDLGVEIYMGYIGVITPEIMRDLYDFSQELEAKLNENKALLSDIGDVRRIRITASLRINRESHHTIISNVFPGEYNKTKYELDTYYCYYQSDFKGLDFLHDAKNLLFYFDVDDISGAERFERLGYLYINVDESKRDDLISRLPNCSIEFEENGTQRSVFG